MVLVVAQAMPGWWRMIKLRSLLHVRGLSGHPTMRECLSPSLGANKLYFGGKYFSLVSAVLGFLDSAWKIDLINGNGDNTNLSVSRTLLPFLWVLLILLLSLVMKNKIENWKLTNNRFLANTDQTSLWLDGRIGDCDGVFVSTELQIIAVNVGLPP